jgi:hypothetical protein
MEFFRPRNIILRPVLKSLNAKFYADSNVICPPLQYNFTCLFGMLWQKNVTLIPTKFVRNYNIILGAIQECLTGKILCLSNVVLSVIAIHFQRNWGACRENLRWFQHNLSIIAIFLRTFRKLEWSWPCLLASIKFCPSL